VNERRVLILTEVPNSRKRIINEHTKPWVLLAVLITPIPIRYIYKPHYTNVSTESLKVDLSKFSEPEHGRDRQRTPRYLDLEPLLYPSSRIILLKVEPKHQSYGETDITEMV
jgi:hypothetical protein